MLSKILARGIQKSTLVRYRANKLAVSGAVRAFSTQHDREDNQDNQIRNFVKDDTNVSPTESHMQFSKNPILKNFGDLPVGEIPEPLKYNRPFQATTLSNGVRVCSERSSSSTATVGVFVGTGSRHDSLATSGAAHVLRLMLTKGTSSTSKADFAASIEQMCAVLSGATGREQSSLNVTCHKGDVGKVVELLGDAFSNASLDAGELELCKQELAAEHDNNHKDYEGTTLEQAHYNSFRDHQLGQPTKGDPDKLQALSVDDIANAKAAGYCGNNIVVVGTGSVDHDSFTDAVNQHFGTIAKTSSVPTPNAEKAVYTPSLMFVRDDEMINSNVAVFYDAPTYKDEDYYGFLLLKNMFGNFEIGQHAGHLNDVRKQYNSMHALLGDLPDVTLAQSHYFTYSDSAIFGNYFFGNEVFTRQMNYCGVCLPTIYSHYLNEVEVIRGRNNLYCSLMAKSEDHGATNADIGQQMLQQGRRVNRSEVAKRVAAMEAYHIKHMCNHWFYDAEPSFTNWGPIETTASCGSYKYYKVNTMSTVSNTHHTLFT